MTRKDKFEELACDFKNEEDCAEDVESEGLNEGEVESEHFGEKEDLRSGVIE